MHIVAIAWLYVALMMAVAEGTNTTGTVIGAIFTFLLYGAAPVALVIYLMNAPARRKLVRQREEAEQEAARAARRPENVNSTIEPDAGGETPADTITPMRKET
jgi:hypothetical protein